jgi:hypothetical protein
VIAVDSSVLVDLLGGGALARPAETALRDALAAGPVVACEVVIAEVVAGLGHGSEMVDALEGAGIRFSALEFRSAARAGEMQRRYQARRRAAGEPGPGPRSVPDFLIGAHALLQCQALLTRDTGFYRDYFKGLKLLAPQPA